MRGFVDRTARALGLVLAALLAGLVALTLWQVFARYVLGQPDPYTEEIIRALLVWLGLLAGAFCVYQRAHVGFALLFDRMSPAGQMHADRATRGLIAFVGLFILVFGGVQLVRITAELEQATPALGIPVGLIYAVIPLSGVLTVLFAIFARPDEAGAEFETRSVA